MPPAVSNLRAYLRLFRASVAFTPAADVVLGYAVASEWTDLPLPGPWILTAACLASSFIFCSSVAFNDFLDRQKDARDAPERPIPSGDLSPPKALAGSFLAAAAALVAAAAAGGLPLLIAAAAVLALAQSYNGFTRKGEWIGLFNLGAVRAADVCLGMICTAGPVALAALARLEVWGIPALYGIYALGLSGTALQERKASPSLKAAVSFLSLSLAAAGVFAFIALSCRSAPLPEIALFLLFLLLPLARLLARKGRTRIEEIVGHLVSGYLLVAAMPAAALISPAAGWILAGLFFISRLLGRFLPPA